MYENQEFQVKQTGNVIIIPENQKLFVSVEESASLTKIMQEHWKRQSYTLVDKKEMADIAIEYGGFVQEAKNAKTDGFSVSYGQGVENVFSQMSEQDKQQFNTSVKQTFAAAGWLAAGQLNKIGLTGLGSGFSNLAAFSAIESLLKATGIGDRINIAVSGHRRGTCIVGCEHWKDVGQTVEVYALVEFPRTKKDMLTKTNFFTWAKQDQPQWGNLFSLAAEALPKMVVPQTIQQQ